MKTFQVTDAFRVNKGDVLLLGIVYPEDKVGIEVAGLEEADALSDLSDTEAYQEFVSLVEGMI